MHLQVREDERQRSAGAHLASKHYGGGYQQAHPLPRALAHLYSIPTDLGSVQTSPSSLSQIWTQGMGDGGVVSPCAANGAQGNRSSETGARTACADSPKPGLCVDQPPAPRAR